MLETTMGGRLPLPADRSRLARDQAAPARTLLDVFEASRLRCGARVAIDAPDAVLTYDELATAARALARRLRGEGIGPGARVGVRIPSGTAELYIAILGVLSAGAAYLPVDADDPQERADQILTLGQACHVLGRGLELTALAPRESETRAPTPGDDAWVIFTSGSTGQPKGVAVSHRSAAAFVDAERGLWRVVPEDRVLAGLSVSFDASCEEIWLAWANGAALVPAPRAIVRSGAELGPWLERNRVTVVSTVPTLAALWDGSSLAGVRLLILGGEACPEELAWRLAAGREVWNTYGPTEATVVSTATRLHPGRPVTIGSALRGWRVAVVDGNGLPVATGEAGELVIGGVGLGRYIDPALDADRYAPFPALGWERAYRTGDIVRETPGGLAFVGRCDDQVKIGGRRIELGEVDSQVRSLRGVRAACTVVRETDAGNRLLVSYVVGDLDPPAIRAELARRLPAGAVPMVVAIERLPVASSGKVDRAALPWPPPAPRGPGARLSATERWLADRWSEQLGVSAINADCDFFDLGGTSLAAAKLASELRERFPSAAVADVYNHRRLGALAVRLDSLEAGAEVDSGPRATHERRWGAVQLGGVFALLALIAPQWLVGILAFDHWYPGSIGPQVGWGWLVAAWFLFCSAPGRALIVLVVRRALIGDAAPGRYPRHSWLACRIWFVERVADICRVEGIAGTPWAARYARLLGHRVGQGARLGTLPPASSLVSIGSGATIESDVDMHGWWIEGTELVVGKISIGAGARIGTRALLMPGATIGAGSEVEPGAVVGSDVGAGERWAGSPAALVGSAGEGWPTGTPDPVPSARAWRAMYGLGLGATNLIGLLAAIPGIVLVSSLAPSTWSARSVALTMVLAAPAIAASFVLAYALLVAVLVRIVSPLIKPGWHADSGATAWALWFSESLMGATRSALFPLYASVYVRPWLRLAGIPVGHRAELCTAVGLNRLTSFAHTSFAADDVVLAAARARDGWLFVAPIVVGSGSFLGNGALLEAGTHVGDGSLVGALTTAPLRGGDGTSWLGSPALALPRTSRCEQPGRTTDPARGLIVARALTELVRILLPATASVALASLVFFGLDAIGAGAGVWTMAAAAPLVLMLAGVIAVALTVVVKWLVIGRYRAGEHPLWSFFVWRDEIVNSCQEQLAGSWLLNVSLGTPVMPVYLRTMGARVGRDVWCETLTITEFELAELGDGSVVNRGSVVETHLFHDRVMQIGPARLGAGATLGPSAAMLPDTELGDGCSVGGRSIVMRGERLPARTRWHGAPVVAV